MKLYTKKKKENFYSISMLVVIMTNFILLINTFKFNGGNDDLIIKFNVENSKIKNHQYILDVKKKLKKEMNILEAKLKNIPFRTKSNSKTKNENNNNNKIPDDIDLDNDVKIYEEQKKGSGNEKENKNEDIYEEDDDYIDDFEEKDLIISKVNFFRTFINKFVINI
jgi:hypothetical protein